jgi:hypothetical protein
VNTMEAIVRTSDKLEFGLKLRCIFGLSIFAFNEVKDGYQDPRVVFLQSLSAENACSAHFGDLNDIADTPEEVFGPAEGDNAFIRLRTSIWGGHFYSPEDVSAFDPCIFPKVETRFWGTAWSEGHSVFPDIIDLGALALYVRPEDSTLQALESLAQEHFVGDADWLNAICSLYKVAVVAGHDGDYYRAYARNDEDFELLTPAVEKAVQSVKETEWFSQNAGKLKWDEEGGGCLMLPEFISGS